MKQYFRIDLRFLVKTHVYQLENEPNNQYFIVAADEKEGLEKILELIENIMALMRTMGYYGFRLQKIYICTVNERNEPVKELGFWRHGSPHLSEYDKNKLRAYFQYAIEVYALLGDKTPKPRGCMRHLFGSYNPAILKKIAKGMNHDLLLEKYKVERLMKAALQPDLQPCKQLLMLVYYAQLRPDEAVRVTKDDVVNHCLVLITPACVPKIIPLHPRLEKMIREDWNPEHYTGSAKEEHTCFDKIIELAELKRRHNKLTSEHQYPSSQDIINSSLIHMLTSGFLREDILLLQGKGLNRPEEYGIYEKTFERLFNSRFYSFPDGSLA